MTLLLLLCVCENERDRAKVGKEGKRLMFRKYHFHENGIKMNVVYAIYTLTLTI